jgi:hypothetical protein
MSNSCAAPPRGDSCSNSFTCIASLFASQDKLGDRANANSLCPVTGQGPCQGGMDKSSSRGPGRICTVPSTQSSFRCEDRGSARGTAPAAPSAPTDGRSTRLPRPVPPAGLHRRTAHPKPQAAAALRGCGTLRSAPWTSTPYHPDARNPASSEVRAQGFGVRDRPQAWSQDQSCDQCLRNRLVSFRRNSAGGGAAFAASCRACGRCAVVCRS